MMPDHRFQAHFPLTVNGEDQTSRHILAAHDLAAAEVEALALTPPPEAERLDIYDRGVKVRELQIAGTEMHRGLKGEDRLADVTVMRSTGQWQ